MIEKTVRAKVPLSNEIFAAETLAGATISADGGVTSIAEAPCIFDWLPDGMGRDHSTDECCNSFRVHTSGSHQYSVATKTRYVRAQSIELA
jgi:hypothetical protein